MLGVLLGTYEGRDSRTSWSSSKTGLRIFSNPGTAGISASKVGPGPFSTDRPKGSLRGRIGGAGIDMTGLRGI